MHNVGHFTLQEQTMITYYFTCEQAATCSDSIAWNSVMLGRVCTCRSDRVVCQASSHNSESRRSSPTSRRAWGSSAGHAAEHAATTSATPAGGAAPPAHKKWWI